MRQYVQREELLLMDMKMRIAKLVCAALKDAFDADEPAAPAVSDMLRYRLPQIYMQALFEHQTPKPLMRSQRRLIVSRGLMAGRMVKFWSTFPQKGALPPAARAPGAAGAKL